ncbi:MAG: hypothetical protein JWN17_2759 [Frankiales bacterium]|nr:hypothetical protein [Frankiales bacterium]
MTSPALRWAVPAVAAGLVACAAVLPSAVSAAGRAPDLAPRSAAQLLVDLSTHRTTALSGTVVQTSRLGLPKLPGAGDTTGPMSLTSGSSTLRVWSDGPDRQRVALLGSLAEYDVVHSGRDLWTYSSGKDEAVHRVLPAPDATEEAPVASAAPTSPADAAAAALKAVDPTTAVTVEEAVTVAGRDARQLVLTPKDTTTLVGSVRLAVDAVTSAPLRVQVFSTSDAVQPAFEVGFTDVTFATPDRSVFAFTAPPGAKVVEKAVPTSEGEHATAPSTEKAPTVLGKGWSRIVVASGVEVPAAQAGMLDKVVTRVPEGRLLKTALVSALLTDDGRLLVGAVTPAALRAAA